MQFCRSLFFFRFVLIVLGYTIHITRIAIAYPRTVQTSTAVRNDWGGNAPTPTAIKSFVKMNDFWRYTSINYQRCTSVPVCRCAILSHWRVKYIFMHPTNIHHVHRLHRFNMGPSAQPTAASVPTENRYGMSLIIQ